MFYVLKPSTNAMVNVINADKTISFKDGDFTGLYENGQYINTYICILIGDFTLNYLKN